METVCTDKHWDVLLVRDPQGTIVAALPYLLGSKLGLRYVLQPQLTQSGGPWFRPDTHENQIKAAQQLIQQLKELHLVYYQQNFTPLVTDWLPFYWAGYRQTTRYTYRIHDISDPAEAFSRFDPSRRQRQIRRMEGTVHPVEVSPEQFVQFHTDYWASRGKKDLLSAPFMLRTIQSALHRRQGLLLGISDNGGTLLGARFVVYDDRCAYSLLSALSPNHPNGTSAMLFWLIIQRLSDVTQAFDFEGSMDPGIGQSYRLYGATQVPYFRITKVL